MQQTWTAIPGFPAYEAGSLGFVRRVGSQQPLAPCPDARGYGKITIPDASGQMRSVWVHRLVCLAFHGEPPEGHQARHLNGKPSDCSAANLCWGSRADNAADRVVHMREKGLPYTGHRTAVQLRGLLPSARADLLGRFLGAPKTLRSIRQAFKGGLINKNKALELIQKLSPP